MKNFVQPGDVVPITAPALLASGDPVLVGSLFGVATTDIANGAEGEVQVEGVFDLPKTTGGGTAFAEGDVARFDVSAGAFDPTAAASGDADVGLVVKAAADGDATVRVKLSGGPAELVP